MRPKYLWARAQFAQVVHRALPHLASRTQGRCAVVATAGGVFQCVYQLMLDQSHALAQQLVQDGFGQSAKIVGRVYLFAIAYSA